MSHADRPSGGNTEPGTELHRLLDVPAGTNVALLRHTYEQQVAAALRSQDQARALRLSTALDELPVTLRHQLYARVHAHPASVAHRSDSGWRQRIPSAEAEVELGPVCRPGHRRRWLAGLLAAAAFVGVALALLTRHSPLPQQIPAPARLPVAASQAPARTVPQSARTEANGYVRVDCPSTALGPGYSGYARRGQIVRCGNGARPEFPLG